MDERTHPSDPDRRALGIEARIRALLSQGDVADSYYQESIEHLSRTSIRAELARSHLLYGEWLRRERRRAEARDQLRTAHDMLDTMGIEAFAQRARRELQATGETARKRTVETSSQLTAQEAQVARLARDGSPTRRSAPACSSARTPSHTTSVSASGGGYLRVGHSRARGYRPRSCMTCGMARPRWRKGADLRVVQEMLGHSSIIATPSAVAGCPSRARPWQHSTGRDHPPIGVTDRARHASVLAWEESAVTATIEPRQARAASGGSGRKALPGGSGPIAGDGRRNS